MYIFFFSKISYAEILDFETENFIKDIISIISDINKYDKEVPFSIILDENPNAFVNQNEKLHLSTGLIKYAESYEALVGVIAHEIAHLQKFHIIKRRKSIKKISQLENITKFSLIAGSLLTENSEYLLQSLITNQEGIKNYFYSFSQDQEREADYYAINTLTKLRLDKNPLKKFLNLLEYQSSQNGNIEEYHKFSTHPIFKERYEIIDNSKKNKEYNFDENLEKRYKFIKAKLFAFTDNISESQQASFKNDFRIYYNSILYARKGKLKKSMKLINKVIINNPDNYYLLEVKADLLYSSGFINESLLFYNKIINFMPSNNYINKRLFDIKFSFIENNNKKKSEELFNKYFFILSIFYNSRDLNIKFRKLAKNINHIDWLFYLDLNEKLFNQEINIVEYKNKIIKLQKNTTDKELLMILNQRIK